MERASIDGPMWTVAVHALIQFDALERLIELGQKALDTELRELHDAMDADYQAFEAEGDEGDYVAHINDEYIEVSETLPCLYWYSQFLMAYSFFERALNALCLSLQKQEKRPISFKDMSGLGITRARIYLAKVCGVTAPFDLSEWQQANLFAEIRNVIAHTNGFVDNQPSDKRSLYARLESQGIELRSELLDQQDARIVLTRDFVLTSIKVYRLLISEVGGLGANFVTPKHGLPSSR